MKLILSRKGFDSSAGGVASPLLPDGRLRSLPIPDPQSPIRYAEIAGDPRPAALVHALTRGKLRGSSRVHLDPDLARDSLPRQPGWRPLLGQGGAAQGHLAKHAVGASDLFLFFGWFRGVEQYRRRWRFVPAAADLHLVHGWLQVGEVIRLGQGQAAPRWAAYHPHCHGDRDANNTLYLAAERLSLDGCETNLPGAGVFSHYAEARQLTGGSQRSQWRLPAAFFPNGRTPLSYHERPERWRRDGQHCWLDAAYRGQEFVLDLTQYDDLRPWLRTLFACAS